MKAGDAIIALVALMPAQHAWAWGQEGHSIVAEIAQRRLEPGPLQKVKTILGGEVSLASVASWADDVRDARPETYNWHFVDIPLTADTYDPARDCAPSAKGDCVVQEIERAKVTLHDGAADPTARREALMFLVHFVGDLHQPLHCVGDARGGNDVPVTFFRDFAKSREQTNLHRVWDGGLIRHKVFDWGAYVDHLEQDWLPGQDPAALVAGTPMEWAEETHRVGQQVWTPENADLGENYVNQVMPTLDRQLAVAGLRLAQVLNKAFQ